MVWDHKVSNSSRHLDLFFQNSSTNSILLTLFRPYRYIRLIVNTYGHVRYRSIPLPEHPIYTGDDVTVVIPTIEEDNDKLKGPVLSILATPIAELMLVTTLGKLDSLKKFATSLDDPRVSVRAGKIANKRLQLKEAIPNSKTCITVLVDDDVYWPTTMLPWLLAPFEDSKMGSVGVCQRVKRCRDESLITRCWNWLGECYIHRRNFEISASHYFDGGTSCMSGRTNALRTEILKDHRFLSGLCNERWGKYYLNADDDNFITRWLVNNDWKTYIQYEPECMLETTLENNPNFLRQCLRWARSNWRSNYTTLFVERKVYATQWWTIYALYFATFTSLGFVTDPLFFYSYYKVEPLLDPSSIFAGYSGWTMVISWYFFTKIVKLTCLFRRYPKDFFYLPVSIVFGFFHGFIKLYALYTWNETAWGSRVDGDTDNAERMAPAAVPNEVLKMPRRQTTSLVRFSGEKWAPMEQMGRPRARGASFSGSISEKSFDLGTPDGIQNAQFAPTFSPALVSAAA